MPPEQTWEEQRALVLAELKRLNSNLETMQEKLNQNTIEVVTMKAKCAMLGALAGGAAGVIGLIISIFRGT